MRLPEIDFDQKGAGPPQRCAGSASVRRLIRAGSVALRTHPFAADARRRRGKNGGPHSAEPSIADKDEAAGSSPARPTTLGLTWANARPLSLRSRRFRASPTHSGPRTHPWKAVRNAGRTRRCAGEGEPRRRRGHRWSRPSRWAMAAASPRPATPNWRGCGGRERWRLLGDRERLPDRHVLDLLPSGGCRAALAVGQGSRSTPTVRLYRRRRFATTTR